MSPAIMRFGFRSAALFFLVSLSLHAQPTAHNEPRLVPSVSAKALIGLPGITPNTEGDLSSNGKNLYFTTEHSSIEIAKRRIIAISSGDERVETGGTTGKIARMAIPYGGGLALGAVTHKKVALLTVEFLDASGEYHGAVFVLRTQDIDGTLARLDLRPPFADSPQVSVAAACPAWKLQSDTVRVEVIGADLQSGFPAEDRVLLYEHLVEQLKSEKTILNVYRAGDRSPEAKCAEFVVTVHAVAFNKGDQALRASVGPLGHFVGTTKLSFHLSVAQQDGSLIVDEEMKKSEGSDSDSLNITKSISKTVVKSLKKSRTHLRKTQMV